MGPEGLDVFKPELNARPRVLFKNLHKWTKVFIGGTAVFGDSDECAEGVNASLVRGGGSVGEAASNNYGDFIIDGLEPGVYDLTLSAPGYKEHQMTVEALESMSLGVIRLNKT